MAQPLATMDEEALKKNTDCVYFLASPLTCKKGNDCEFRHSESARINPRDCWYWLGGKCLMPDCPFRHPPLEGRPAAGTAGVGPPVPGAAGVNKSRTPCFFFSQGYCAKGDKCPYMHGTTSPAPGLQQAPTHSQRSVRAGGAESNDKKTGSGAGNGDVVLKPASVEASTDAPNTTLEARRAAHGVGRGTLQVSPRKEGRAGGAFLQNGVVKGRTDGPPALNSAVPGGSSRLRIRQGQPGDDRLQNGMESEEWWEESSPGFDVLVDAGPDRSRYNEDPDFGGSHDSGLELGRVGPGQRRGRGMHTADDMEQYDYEYAGCFDQLAYDSGGQYNRGGYEAYEQQGGHGYDHASAYDQMGHPRGVAYGDRMNEEMYVRDRERMMSNRDGEGRPGNNQRGSRMLKRHRADGPPQHVLDNHSRRQRTEFSDEYPSHGRVQDDSQKLHEQHLRQQLFVQQQGISKSNSGNLRRSTERSAGESGGVARRALLDMKEEHVGPPVERTTTKNLLKGRGAFGEVPGIGTKGDHEQAGHRGESGRSMTRAGDGERFGLIRRDNDRGRGAPKGVEGMPETEVRGLGGSSAGMRRSEVKKEQPSSFAGPKSLAQILAEKKKGGPVEDSLKVGEMPVDTGKAVQSREREVHDEAMDLPSESTGLVAESGGYEGSKGAPSVKNQNQVASALTSEHFPGEGALEERKISLGRVVGQEPTKVASFVGPKSLSAILQAKRKADLETAESPEETTRGHIRRRVTQRVGDSVVVKASAGTGMDVEDGELLPDAELARTTDYSEHPTLMHQTSNQTVDKSSSDATIVATRESKRLQDDDGEGTLLTSGDNNGDVDYAISVARSAEELDPIDTVGEEPEHIETAGYEADTGDKDISEPEEDDEEYDEEEDDDFAKKLGGFFS